MQRLQKVVELKGEVTEAWQCIDVLVDDINPLSSMVAIWYNIIVSFQVFGT